MKKRFLAMLLAALIVVGMLPAAALAATPAMVATNLSQQDFKQNGDLVRFTIALTPNDDVNKYYRVCISVDDPYAVKSLAYSNAPDSELKTLILDEPSGNDFLLDTDRSNGGAICFQKAGTFAVTVSIKDAIDDSLICKTTNYVKVTPTYSVSYNMAGGSGTLPVDGNLYTTGDTVTVFGSDGITKDGYSFAGWLNSDNGAVYQGDDTFNIGSANVTLTAQWKENTADGFTVTYDLNGGSGTAVTDTNAYAEGTAVTAASIGDVVKDGYEFAGWKNLSTGALIGAGNLFLMPASNVILTAQWDPIATYSVKYNLNAGSGATPVDSNQYKTGDTVTVLGSDGITRDGYSFSGWLNNDNGTLYQTGETFSIDSANVTLTAQWKENTASGFTVTYVMNNGTGETKTDDTTYAKGAYVTVLGIGDATKEGFEFVGWKNLDTNASYEVGNILTMPDNNVILTAQWKPVVTYSVTYNLSGGSGTAVVDTDKYMEGASVTVLGIGDVTKANCVFLGWENKDTGVTYSPDESFNMPGKNVTLTAQWETKYKVTYNLNGGSGDYVEDTALYSAGDLVTVLGIGGVTKEGYVFDGWKDNASGVVYGEGANCYMTAGGMILTAQWKAMYTVSYDVNGSEDPAPDKAVYEAGATATVTTAELSKEGFVFNGWKDEVTGISYTSGQTFTMPANNITLTAQWLNTYTVKFDLNDDGNSGNTALEDLTELVEGSVIAAPVLSATEYTVGDVTYYFNGWKNQKNDAAWVFAADTVCEAAAESGVVTLVAQWDVVQRYTVVFDDGLEDPLDDYVTINGVVEPTGQISFNDVLATADVYAAVPTFARVNYILGIDTTFNCDWYLDPDYSVAFDITKTLNDNKVALYADDMTKTLTLYAKWTCEFAADTAVEMDAASLTTTGTYNTYYSSFIAAYRTDTFAAKSVRVYRNFYVMSGSLPDGLHLNQRTGEIYGVPTEVGTFNFTVKMANDEVKAISKEVAFSITINALDLTVNHLDGDTHTYHKTYGDKAESIKDAADTTVGQKAWSNAQNLDMAAVGAVITLTDTDNSVVLDFDFSDKVSELDAYNGVEVDPAQPEKAPDLAYISGTTVPSSRTDTLEAKFQRISGENAGVYKVYMLNEDVTGAAIDEGKYAVKIAEKFMSMAAEDAVAQFGFTINKAVLSNIDLLDTTDFFKTYGDIEPEFYADSLKTVTVTNASETTEAAMSADSFEVTITYANGIVDVFTMEYGRASGENAGDYKLSMPTSNVKPVHINDVTPYADTEADTAAKLAKNYETIEVAEDFTASSTASVPDKYIFVINKAVLSTIDLPDSADFSKVYGEDEPEFCLSMLKAIEVTNAAETTKAVMADDSFNMTIAFANGIEDTISMEYLRVPGEDAGTYKIYLPDENIIGIEINEDDAANETDAKFAMNYSIPVASGFAAESSSVARYLFEIEQKDFSFVVNGTPFAYGSIKPGAVLRGTLEGIVESSNVGIQDSANVNFSGDSSYASTSGNLKAGTYTVADAEFVMTNSADPMGTASTDTSTNYYSPLSDLLVVEAKELKLKKTDLSVIPGTTVTEDDIMGMFSLTGVISDDEVVIDFIKVKFNVVASDGSVVGDADMSLADAVAALDTTSAATYSVTMTATAENALTGADAQNYLLADAAEIAAKLAVKNPTPPSPPVSPVVTYTITVTASEGGSVSPNGKVSVNAGSSKTLKVVPDAGYEIENILVDGEEINTDTIYSASYSYTFDDVKANHTFEVEFKTNYTVCPADSSCVMSNYTDLDPSAWYHDGVHYCLEKGLMNGMGNDTFVPNGTATRAMIVTILARMNGVDTTTGDTWYSAAVEWGVANGITDGTNMMDEITREQIITMMFRYCKLKGGNVGYSSNAAFLAYNDADQVSDWAVQAMEWACSNGLINGFANLLNPRVSTTRAEIATIIMRFNDSIMK